MTLYMIIELIPLLLAYMTDMAKKLHQTLGFQGRTI